MKNKIEDKLLLLRANKYAKSLEGVDSLSISTISKNDFLWHKDELKKVNSIDNDNFTIYMNHPVKIEVLVKEITSLLSIKKRFSCSFIYEGRCSIFVSGKDFHLFLTSIFKLNKTYDLSLIFESPDRVISISDDEYRLSIYYTEK